MGRTPYLRIWRWLWQGGQQMPDNQSTELALIVLLREQLADVRALSARVEHIGERLGRLEHNTQQRHTELMTALETLTESVNAAATAQTELTTAVNAAIVHIGTPGATDAQILTAATAIDANTASDKALVLALNEALEPTVVIPPVDPV